LFNEIDEPKEEIIDHSGMHEKSETEDKGKIFDDDDGKPNELVGHTTSTRSTHSVTLPKYPTGEVDQKEMKTIGRGQIQMISQPKGEEERLF
jgi:hypothetical protein